MNFKKWLGAKVILEDGLRIKLRFYKWYVLDINFFINISLAEEKELGL